MIHIDWLLPIAHAAGNAPAITPVGAPGVTQDPTTTITNIATNIRAILLLLAGVLATLYLMWSGFQYITAAGDPAKTKTARAGIVTAVIGIIIIVATTAIIRFSIGLGKCAAGTTSSTNACDVQATQTKTTGKNGSGNWWDNLWGSLGNGVDSGANGTTGNDCPDGTTVGPNGECIPNPPTDNPNGDCPDGTTVDANGNCVSTSADPYYKLAILTANATPAQARPIGD